MEDNKVVGTADMPEPETLEYGITFKLSDAFLNDVVYSLQDFSYMETDPIIKTVMSMHNSMPIAKLNETIRMIASFPYKNVKAIMHVIETNQPAYFEQLTDGDGNALKKAEPKEEVKEETK